MKTVKIKCANTQTGEVYFAYSGAEFDRQRAECEQRAIHRQWPHINAEIIEQDGDATKRLRLGMEWK